MCGVVSSFPKGCDCYFSYCCQLFGNYYWTQLYRLNRCCYNFMCRTNVTVLKAHLCLKHYLFATYVQCFDKLCSYFDMQYCHVMWFNANSLINSAYIQLDVAGNHERLRPNWRIKVMCYQVNVATEFQWKRSCRRQHQTYIVQFLGQSSEVYFTVTGYHRWHLVWQFKVWTSSFIHIHLLKTEMTERICTSNRNTRRI